MCLAACNVDLSAKRLTALRSFRKSIAHSSEKINALSLPTTPLLLPCSLTRPVKNPVTWQSFRFPSSLPTILCLLRCSNLKFPCHKPSFPPAGRKFKFVSVGDFSSLDFDFGDTKKHSRSSRRSPRGYPGPPPTPCPTARRPWRTGSPSSSGRRACPWSPCLSTGSLLPPPLSGLLRKRGPPPRRKHKKNARHKSEEEAQQQGVVESSRK